VYSTENGWGAVWNGAVDAKPRRLKMKFQSAEETMCIVESAIAEGERSPRWEALECGWKKTKKGDGYYRKAPRDDDFGQAGEIRLLVCG